MTINDILKSSSLASYEVEFILQELLNSPRHLLYQKQIDEKTYKAFLAIEEKRKQGFPLQYLLGVAYFYGLKLKIVPGVFIPRPETEILVDLALKHIKRGMRVLDVGSGSGNIALAIAVNRQCFVEGIDISSLCIVVGGENRRDLEKQGILKGQLRFVLGDFVRLLDRDMSETYDVIVSNPPYIDFKDYSLLPEDVKKEPPIALFAGEGGMFFYRKLFEIGREILKSQGKVFVELPGDEEKTLVIKDIAGKLGYRQIKVFNDLNDRPRVLYLKK